MATFVMDKKSVKDLAKTLLGHRWEDKEGALLWAVFALAADVIDPETGGIGRTKLVEVDDTGKVTVELDRDYGEFEDAIRPTLPARMAEAFAPGGPGGPEGVVTLASGSAPPPPQGKKVTVSPTNLVGG
jgi:hypothetical protein